jgi:hypothetical protein
MSHDRKFSEGDYAPIIAGDLFRRTTDLKLHIKWYEGRNYIRTLIHIVSSTLSLVPRVQYQ